MESWICIISLIDFKTTNVNLLLFEGQF